MQPRSGTTHELRKVTNFDISFVVLADGIRQEGSKHEAGDVA